VAQKAAGVQAHLVLVVQAQLAWEAQVAQEVLGAEKQRARPARACWAVSCSAA
jgi:hypothetical protein